MKGKLSVLCAVVWLMAGSAAADVIKLGLNYPKTGPYFAEGLDQIRAAQLAVDEINAKGGVLGSKLQLVIRDSKSKPDVTKANVAEMIDKEGVKMVFGGSASNVAVAAGEVAAEKGIPFFGTLTYANSTTGAAGNRFVFRECYNGWMAAKVLSKYLRARYAGKKYFFITANYVWGWETEDSLRKFTGSEDKSLHRRVLTPFPNARITDFKNALRQAQLEKPDVLALVLFGQDMVKGVNAATEMGLKSQMQIVVPNLTLAMAEASGASNMAGVVGAIPWDWKIPYTFRFQRGADFVEAFSKLYGRYPSTSGASAYTIVYEWKAAVERAKSVEPKAVIKALEGHTYTVLKDAQRWRDFDHQSVQTVYAVRVNSPEVVNRDKYRLDFFEVIDSMPGDDAAQTREEWEAERIAANKPPMLGRLPGE